MIGGSTGLTVYDNASHTLPVSTVSTGYAYVPTNNMYTRNAKVAKYVVNETTGKKELRYYTSTGQWATMKEIVNGVMPDGSAPGKSVTVRVTGNLGVQQQINDSTDYYSAIYNGTDMISSENKIIEYGRTESTSYSVSNRYIISNGYICHTAAVTNSYTSNSSAVTKAGFKSFGMTYADSGKNATYVSSRDSEAYPKGDDKDGYWWTFIIADNIEPKAVYVNDDDMIYEPSEDVVINTVASDVTSLQSYGSIEYTYVYSIDGGATWQEVSSTSELSVSATIPEDGIMFLAGVTVKDNIGFVGDMITSSNIILTLTEPPIIADMDRDLGAFRTLYNEDGKYAYPTVDYTVTDYDVEEETRTLEDGSEAIVEIPTDLVTVEEYVDHILVNSYNFKGDTEHTFMFNDHVWLTLPNGEHTMRIVATDDSGEANASTTRTFTFTKAIDEISVMFSEPMEDLDAMYLAVESMVAELPTGCNVWVYVCNDGFDEHPSWQDATVEVRNGTKIYITNAGIYDGMEESETAPDYKWGYNVWVRIQRGTAEGPIFLESVEGYWR